MIGETVSIGLLLLMLTLGTLVDFRCRRLPNVLTVTGAMAGLVGQFFIDGTAGVWNGAAGMCMGLFLLLPLYLMSWMGAGDVKMMAAVGTYLGWPDSVLAVGLTTGVGSLAALGVLGIQGGLRMFLRRYGVMAKCLLTTGQFAYMAPADCEPAKLRFPYAFAIALGTVGTLWWGGRLDAFFHAAEILYHG